MGQQIPGTDTCNPCTDEPCKGSGHATCVQTGAHAGRHAVIQDTETVCTTFRKDLKVKY